MLNNSEQSGTSIGEGLRESANALQELGLDEQEIMAHREDSKRREFNRLVCVCGHAMNKHNEFNPGLWSCHTARMYCPCEKPRAVVEVSDTRYFMTKSRGYGAQHALSTGLSKLHERGGTSRLIIDPKCFRCEEPKSPLLPAAFDRDVRLVFKPGHLNGLFCHDCLVEFPIDHYSKN
jgi:hypothetical protein